MGTSSSSYNLCAYLGKHGLLGGMPDSGEKAENLGSVQDESEQSRIDSLMTELNRERTMHERLTQDRSVLEQVHKNVPHKMQLYNHV